jgi:hypothetical protein
LNFEVKVCNLLDIKDTRRLGLYEFGISSDVMLQTMRSI